MHTLAIHAPQTARLSLRATFGLGIAACMLALLCRWLSPVPSEAVTMMWPVGGVLLAALIQLGVRGVVAIVAGAIAAGMLMLPSQPQTWITVLAITTLSSIAGAVAMRYLTASLRAYTGRTRLTRVEWLYCVYVAGILAAALLAGAMAATTRSFAHLHEEFLWYEVAGAYWLLHSLGCIVFTPLCAAAFSSLGFSRADIPYSAKPFSLRTSIDWRTVFLAAALAALIGWLTFTGFNGAAYVLQLWCIILMAWCALRTSALPAYVTLAVIAMTLLPLRAILIGRLGGTEPEYYELLEGVLIISAGIVVTQIMQAVMQQATSQQRVMEKQLRTDPQSGLLNETGLREMLAQPLQSQQTAVAMFHFPALPQLVAGLGFERALRVQSTLAERISLFGRLATRLDPTTYCCMWDAPDEAQLQQTIHRTEEQLAGLRIRAGEGTLRLQCLMGVLLVDAKPEAAGASLPDAIMAALWQLEGSLQSGATTTTVVRISDQLNLAARARGERAMMIRQALEQGQLELFAQPIESNLAPQQVDTPIMCEVLARLRLEDGTILPPGAFISICEQHGLIQQLDRTMVQKTFSWFAARPDALQRLGKCSINLSGQSIGVAGVAAEIRVLATSLNLPVGKFSFEITESEAIQDASAAVRTVAELRAAGFGTAIDDFGTGLATFSYLKRFEVDLIKIDGAFIRLLDDGMRRSEVDREIVRSIVRVAQTLGVKTAAEFVETAAIREHVTALGVHYSQGYAIAKPMPIAELFA